jgi:hypothetical protein
METRRIVMEKVKSATQAGGPESPKGVPRGSLQDPKRRAVAEGERQRRISEAAYYRAEQRGFARGRELDDWLAAEIQIDKALHEPTAKKTSKGSRSI